jgi:antirestriction protein
MQDQPNEQERKWHAMERDVVYLLTDPDRYPSIWSIADVGREIDYFDPEAVVRPLRNAGLVHRTSDGFVFATAAASRLVQLVGHVI